MLDLDMSSQEEDELVYGTDFKVGEPTLPQNQIAIISGKENLSQAIEHRIMTPLNLYYEILEEYGTNIREFIALKKTPDNIQWICFNLQSFITRDERIEEANVSYSEFTGFVLEYKGINSNEMETMNLNDLDSIDMAAPQDDGEGDIDNVL